jgi:hypothetical protein
MQRARRWIALGLLLAAPVVPAQKLLAQGVPAQNQTAPAVTPAAAPPLTPPAAPAATPNHKSHKVQKVQKVQKELVLPPLPSGPLSQMPMDQIPATPAKVSFENGLLTISAQNSTLGEILRDVRKLTGASIEIPQGSGASERVIAHLGPGAPRDVLAGLLNGSSFNYVMIGTSSDHTAVASVILTAKPSSGDAQTAANVPNNPLPNSPMPGNGPGMPPNRFQPTAFNAQNGVPQPGQPANVQPVAADEDSKDDEPDTAEDTAEDQAQPAQTDANANANANAQPQQPDPNQPNAGPKTPEQILDMLRRQQQPGGAVVPPPQPPQQ